MPFRFYFFLLFFTFLFLFYPGEHPFYQLIAYNRDSFFESEKREPVTIHPIPIQPAVPPPAVTAYGVYIVDLDSFTPLYSKNAHTPLFPASTTKVITALTTLDLYEPDTVVTVKQPRIEGQVMHLIPGERITVENLLYGILVHSGNDAAYALADAYGYDAFIEQMNQKAADLGMKNSHFTNPAGLDNVTQLSTAYDLSLAGRELLKNPYLRKMVGTKEIIISDVDYQIFHTLTNVNRLLGTIQGLGGLKTGYTEAAGENLISFYRHDGHDYIIVVMNSEDRFADTTTLVDWIKAQVQYVVPEISS